MQTEWAPYIASRIIEPLADADVLALKLMRAKVTDILDEAYDALRKEPEKEMVSPETIANFIARQVMKSAKGTAWEKSVSHPLTRISFHHELVRSIKSIINP